MMRALIITAIVLSLAGCGRKAPLDAPSGYEDNPPIEVPGEDEDGQG